MNLEKLPRKEKEELYIKIETKLQKRCNNPLDWDRDFIKDLSDEKLDYNINHVKGILKVDNFFYYFKMFFYVIFFSFIFLGIFGLLIFGIKQLF